LQATLNSNIPGRTKTEYYVDNLDKNKAYGAEYYNTHKEQCQAKNNRNYAKNKEYILLRQRTPWECECGRVVQCGKKAQHVKSLIHHRLMAAIQAPEPEPESGVVIPVISG
jgi:hypothetical protein